MTQPTNPTDFDTDLPDFDAVRPETVVPALEALLCEYDAALDALLDADAAPGWALVEAETEWTDRVERAWSPVSHLALVADEPALRAAHDEGVARLTAHEARRRQDARLYNAYRAIAGDPAFADLGAAEQRLVALELLEFRLAGAELDEAGKARMQELLLRLARLGTRFSENVLDATQAWTRDLDEAELAGLPESERRMLAALARARGRDGWTVDLSFPAYHAVVAYAENRALREAVYRAYHARASRLDGGSWDNTDLIGETLALRHELAGLLGYASYAEYALARRMATAPSEVLAFLRELAGRARPLARAQLDAVRAFAREEGFAETLEPWDLSFWSERLRERELGLSDEMLKPWLPLERMLDGLFDVAARLFGIAFERDAGVAAWHPDVRFYWLRDAGGRRFAGVYMDFFTRPEKRGGAWMDVCRSRRRVGDRLRAPVAYLTCNFARPAGDEPSLLTHDEVETLFHEFGHCLHHLLTTVDWPQVGGLGAVEWDAVELPSQLLENWCWTRDFLHRHARHHETGEPLPDDLAERLLRSRHWLGGLRLVRQLEYALTDFRLHHEYDPQAPVDPLDVMREVNAEVGVVTLAPGNRFLNSFGHIFGGGYAAGYYSYLWAEQLSADAWGRFEKAGVYDAEAGAALRREILEVGAVRPALESFVAFRGRPPQPGPLLRHYGLDPEAKGDRA